MGVSVTPLYYVFEPCGCKIEPERIFRRHQWIDGKCICQIQCPGHPGNRISGFVCKCVMCGKTSYGPRSLMCPECRYEEKKRKMREKARLHPKKSAYKPGPKQSMRLYDPTRIHCWKRKDCLNKYRAYACLPCKNCAEYRLQHGNHDPLEMRRGAAV